MGTKRKIPDLRIHLLRHGESEWQVGVSESHDSGLTPRGHTQAEHLARRVRNSRSMSVLSSVLASPLKRALQTVECMDVEFTVAHTLKEACFDLKSCLPTFAGPHLHRTSAPPSGAYPDFQSGVSRLLNDLVEQARNIDLYAVTHGGVIKTLLRTIHGTDAVCYRIDNCSWTTLAWYHGRWHVECLNDVSHLPQGLRT